MECPHCNQPVQTPTSNHKMCVIELFRTDAIKSIQDWEASWRPRAIVKRKVIVRIPKAELTRT
jgi:hypothetical protein